MVDRTIRFFAKIAVYYFFTGWNTERRQKVKNILYISESKIFEAEEALLQMSSLKSDDKIIVFVKILSGGKLNNRRGRAAFRAGLFQYCSGAWLIQPMQLSHRRSNFLNWPRELERIIGDNAKSHATAKLERESQPDQP